MHLTTQHNTIRNMPLRLSSSAHSRWLLYSLRDNHIGPISQRNRGLHVHDELARTPTQHTQARTGAFVSLMMQTGAEITGSGGSVWEYTPQRWSYTDRWGGRHGTHTHTQCSINPHSGFVNVFGGQTDKQRHTNTLTITHSKWHGQTLYCAHPQTITHSHTHGLLCVYSVSWSYLCGQLLCGSRHSLQKGKED